MIKLPFSVEAPTETGLRKLLIFGHAKLGKTHLITQLPNCLVLDLESGSRAYPGMKIDVKAIAQKENKSVLSVLREIADQITEENKKKGEPVYDYICIDTVTALEEYAIELATEMYKSTTIGKNYKGNNVVTDLERGLGYGFLRNAFKKLYEAFEMLPKECLILIGHVKSSSILKMGKDLSARDLNLTGKNKLLVSADVDAIGFMYRDETQTKNILSFKKTENDLATGSRVQHLSNREITISELQEDGSLVTHWEDVFPNLKS